MPQKSDISKIIHIWQAIDRIIHAEYHNQARKNDLTLEQFHLLLHLEDGSFRLDDEPPTIGSIADFTGQASHTMTDRDKRLEKKGLVTKTRDSSDQRICRVAITDAGRKLVREIVTEGGGDFLKNALDNLEKTEQSALHDALRIFLNSLVETAEHSSADTTRLHPLIGLKKH